jgi:hypothetical protein
LPQREFNTLIGDLDRFTDFRAEEFRVFLNERLIVTEVGVIERPQNLSYLEVFGSVLSFFNFSTNLVWFHRCPFKINLSVLKTRW